MTPAPVVTIEGAAILDSACWNCSKPTEQAYVLSEGVYRFWCGCRPKRERRAAGEEVFG